MKTAVSFEEIIPALAIVFSLIIYAVNEFKGSQTKMIELDRFLVENPDFVKIYL